MNLVAENAALPMREAIADDKVLLRVRHLGVHFQTARGPLYALHDLSLDVARSRTLAIVGESGSGKSVLSRSILRLLGPMAHTAPAAQIIFDGRDLLRLDNTAMQAVRGRRIGMVFQDPMTALNPVRPIGVQLTEGMRLHLGLNRRTAEARAIELLGQVGIASPERRMRQLPHELSGGMRQRVVIAMAIACEPDLLIADEPTTALDVTVQAEILDLLRQLQRERQMTMILVTHDLGVAAGHADDIAVMYAGQIVEKSPTQALFRAPRIPYTRDLLRSTPRLEDPPHAVLPTIGGRPPAVHSLAGGCRYAPRCGSRTTRCDEQRPELEVADIPTDRSFRCWYPLDPTE